MSRQSDVWIYQQLEPNDVLTRGNHKRHTSTLKELWECLEKAPPIPRISDEEKERLEDEYLATKGIK